MRKLTLTRLKELLRYDPVTGEFRWLVRRGHVMAGAIAGSINSVGHRQIEIDGRKYLAHVLAWFYMLGVWPETDLDHESTVKDDNRWSNLREASRSQNVANTGARKNNKVGVKGVTTLPSGRFAASIKVDGKQIYLGSFDTVEAAGKAYKFRADEAFGEFARA
ncbi:MAG: HNH endonuclease [Mesorhizobium sp.]|nr:MAG: HNH endonuclease [Mesorhizobium sp.]